MYEETMYAIAAGSQQPFSDEETQPAIDEGDEAQQANAWRRGPGDDEADLEHLRRIASLTGNEQYQWLQVGPIGTTSKK